MTAENSHHPHMSLRPSSVAVDFAAHSALCESKTAACTLAAPFSTGAADTRPQVRTLPEPRVRARFTTPLAASSRDARADRDGPDRVRSVTDARTLREPARISRVGGALSARRRPRDARRGARTPTRRALRRDDRDDAASRVTACAARDRVRVRRRFLGLSAAFSFIGAEPCAWAWWRAGPPRGLGLRSRRTSDRAPRSNPVSRPRARPAVRPARARRPLFPTHRTPHLLYTKAGAAAVAAAGAASVVGTAATAGADAAAAVASSPGAVATTRTATGGRLAQARPPGPAGRDQVPRAHYLFSIPIKEFQIVEHFIGTSLTDEVMKIMPVQKQTSAGRACASRRSSSSATPAATSASA